MESIFYVKIIDQQKQQTKPTNKEPEKPNLPKIIKIVKKEDKWVKDKSEEEAEYTDWNEVEDWNSDSVIHIITADEEEHLVVSAVAINMDSNILHSYISKNKTKNEKDIDFFKNQYLSKIYLHGLFLYSILNKIYSLSNNEKKYKNEDQNPEDLVAELFKSYGNVLIHLDTNKEILDYSMDEE